jgi:arginyl-tRNA synthetase
LYEILGLGAMKFYLLRVDPKKRMIFNPEESIDFHGFTGSFVQYTYARIQSILRKVGNQPSAFSQLSAIHKLLPLERELIIFLEKYTTTLSEAAEEMNPSVIANYVFNLAKLFNSFYVDHSVANAETEEKKILRLRISVMTAHIIKNGLGLLGIKVPARM